MCGYAFVSSRNKSLFPIGPDLLKHRGPDHTSEIDLNWSRARHWRLSIQDLTSYSNQPFNEEDNFLVYNGELYDFRDLGKRLYAQSFQSDTQLLFHALKNDDFNLIDRESGFYSFLYINDSTRSFFGARDHFGKKPLYFYFDDDLLVVASEDTTVREITEQYGKTISIDTYAISHYFQYKDLHFGKTFHEGIKELAPGASLKFCFDTWTLTEGTSWEEYYQSPPFYKRKNDPVTASATSCAEVSMIGDYFTKAITKRFLADVPVQIALSGGVDSTLLALIAKDFDDGFDNSYTVISSARPTELKKSRSLCEKFSMPQTIIDFDRIDVMKYLKLAIAAQGGPLSHPHALAVYLLTKESAKRGKVLVTGEGADELLYGYEHYAKSEAMFAFSQHLDPKTFFEISECGTTNSENHSYLSSYLENNDRRDLDVKTHLLSLLRRNDRISMRNSVELRSAYLDNKLFAAIAFLQDKNRLAEGKEKLVEMISGLYDEYEVDKSKIGFYVPFDDWFNKEIKINDALGQIVNRALNYLKTQLHWTLKAGTEMEGKLAWAIVNIGVFLELEGGAE